MKLQAIDALPAEDARRILREILTAATTPAFGALPLREVNLVLFQALRDAGVVRPDASLYTLMTDLRISRSRARALLFDLEIRRAQAGEGLDAAARRALAQPKGFVMDGAWLVFGIENPVVQAHIKDRVAGLGHLTDASFDASLVRLKPQALGALVEALMSEEDRAAFREAMVAAGLSRDKSLATALTEGIKHIATRYLGETAVTLGEGYIEKLADFVMPHARRAIASVTEVLQEIGAAREGQPQMRRL